MSNLFIGQLLLTGFNFPFRGSAFAAGQILPLSQNTALFSLLGTTYGGDGKTTFALPDLQGRVPVGAGQSAGLQDYFLGQSGGSENVTLLTSEMPMHNHNLNSFPGSANNVSDPNGNSYSHQPIAGTSVFGPSTASLNQTLSPNAAVRLNGGSLPHSNQMPTLALNWLILLQGVFPIRG
jgi:microcystin-dependent protein